MLLRCFYLLVLLLSSQPQLLSAQQLSGTYCFGNGFEVTCIDFTMGNRFDYSYMSCTGGKRGAGVYTVMGGHLILLFRQLDTARQPITWRIDTSGTGSDSVRWQFVVTDKTGEPFPGAILKLKEEEIGTVTDMDGKALMIFPNAARNLSIVISSFGSENNAYPIVLRQDRSYALHVVINDSFLEPVPNGTTYRYAIRNIRRNRFELKRDYRGTPFETYRRVQEKNK